MHLNSKLVFENIALKFFEGGGKGLEIGPAGFPSAYMNLLDDFNITWNTLDIDSKHIGNAAGRDGHIVSKELYHYPIDADTYDYIIAGQVIEHVADIWKWLDELKRIVKPQGKIVIICPISWPYHEAPIDCWRIFPAGFKVIAEKVNLRLLHSSFHSYEVELIPKSTPTYANVSSFLLSNRLSFANRVKIFLNSISDKIPFISRFKLPISVSYDSIAIFSKN